MLVKTLQTAFTTGEISPRLYNRADLEQFYTAAEELTNFIPTPQGPIIRRPGSTFITSLPTAVTDCRLIPFIFNVDQAMVICFANNGKVYFFYAGGIISNQDTTPYSVSHSFTADEIHELDYAQSGDIIYLVHKNHRPFKLSRYSNTDWRIETITYTAQPSQWVAGNYPSLLTFFDQRLIYAGTPKEPQTLWFSRTGLYEDFTKVGPDDQVLDDMAIEYTIASDDANGIVWMTGLDILIVGTSGAEYKVAASVLGESVTPNNIKISKITNYGSNKVKAVPLGLGIAYVQRGGRNIRHVGPDALGTYNSTDLTLFADHICKAGIKEIDLQTNPGSILWAALHDGSLVGCSYDAAQKVLSWHKHALGGNKQILSIVNIPDTDGKDQLWMASKFKDSTAIFIEALLNTAEETDNVEDSWFLDSAITNLQSSSSGTTIGGLEHLAGKEVGVLIDGWVHPNVVVSQEGTIELQDTGDKIIVGLPFESYFRSVNYQAQETNTVGSTRRIHTIGITLLQSLGLTISAGGSEEEVYFGPTRIMNKAQALYSGTRDIAVPSVYKKELRVEVKQNKPLPCEITGIIAQLTAN